MKRYAECYSTLVRTLDSLQREVEELLKSHGLSEPQYGVLCVLQRAHPEALSCGDIAAGMVSRDPDITRLLDRLERLGLIARRRGSPDRRLVSVNILEPGLELLGRIEGPLAGLHQRLFSGLQETEIPALLESLDRIRTATRQKPAALAPRPQRNTSFSLSGVG